MDQRKPVDPNRWYPNPSFGLEIWGPLVPANDIKGGLYALAGIQMATGIFMWWIPGRGGMAKAAATQAARMASTVPRSTVWKNRALRAMGVFTGTYLVFLSGLELVRLQLTRDPWVEDAREARRRAEATLGKDKVSWWFGPTGYRAVEYSEWKRRVDEQLAARTALDDGVSGGVATGLGDHKWKVVKDVRGELKESNRKLAQDILEHGVKKYQQQTDQAAAPQAGHARVVEKELQHKSETHDKQTHMDEDGEAEEWIQLDPWRTLRDEIEVHMRVFPHTWSVDVDEGHDGETEPEKALTSVILSIGESPHGPSASEEQR